MVSALSVSLAKTAKLVRQIAIEIAGLLSCGGDLTILLNRLNSNSICHRARYKTIASLKLSFSSPRLVTRNSQSHAAAKLLGCTPAEVLPFSTGVILEHLPADRLIAGLPAAQADLAADHWYAAAHAIMTTDTVAKAASRRVTSADCQFTVTGISKGAGMIRPNMATMLGFVATDAGLGPALLRKLATDAADVSFNCITVDGDTSTNDSFVVIATGASGCMIDSESSPHWPAVRDAVTGVAQELAQAIVRDGEGATKFITVKVGGGGTADECRKVAYAIGHSPLVKTAFFASDPNLGRILAAIGYAGIADLDAAGVRVWLGTGDGEVLVSENGGRAASYREEDGARIMQAAEITVRVDLGRGAAGCGVVHAHYYAVAVPEG